MYAFNKLSFVIVFFIIVLVTSCGNTMPPPISGKSWENASDYPPSSSRELAPAGPKPIIRSEPPAVHAESAIVVEVESGRVLYAKNADLKRPVASTQKIVTALAVLSAGSVNQLLTIEPSDSACEPTNLAIRAGEQYTRKQLLEALLVKSANNVARALARDVAGSQEGFAQMMNRKALNLGMRNSNFVNPNGLTESGQYSTARDIAIAARALYYQPLLRSIVSMKGLEFRFNNGRSIYLENTNKVLKTLPYCNGMKTGTTNASGRCLVSSGSLNGRAVIAVVLKSNTANIWKDSANLLRWGLEG